MTSVLVLVLSVGCSSPTSPTQAARFPTELQPVMAFLDADAWVHPLLKGRALGDYVRAHVREIRMDWSLAPAVGARAIVAERRILWQPRNTVDIFGLPSLAGQLLHEARHLEQQRWHSCGTHDFAGDRTMEEGGAFAVHILYLEHVGEVTAATELRTNYIGCRSGPQRR